MNDNQMPDPLFQMEISGTTEGGLADPRAAFITLYNFMTERDADNGSPPLVGRVTFNDLVVAEITLHYPPEENAT